MCDGNAVADENIDISILGNALSKLIQAISLHRALITDRPNNGICCYYHAICVPHRYKQKLCLRDVAGSGCGCARTFASRWRPCFLF